jgi:hypothetical protein
LDSKNCSSIFSLSHAWNKACVDKDVHVPNQWNVLGVIST